MQPACVLHDGAPPRDRHGQEQSVQSRVVEALSDIPPCREDQELLAIADGGQSGQRLSALLRADANDEPSRAFDLVIALLSHPDRKNPASTAGREARSRGFRGIEDAV